jgi:hypothetical protein
MRAHAILSATVMALTAVSPVTAVLPHPALAGSRRGGGPSIPDTANLRRAAELRRIATRSVVSENTKTL